jgi:hypothetical protein
MVKLEHLFGKHGLLCDNVAPIVERMSGTGTEDEASKYVKNGGTALSLFEIGHLPVGMSQDLPLIE